MTDTSSPCSALLGDAIFSAPNKGQLARLLGVAEVTGVVCCRMYL
jgi:hypothetical protein